jgi:hypothetical protein
VNVLAMIPGMGYHRESAEDAWRQFAFFAGHLR